MTCLWKLIVLVFYRFIISLHVSVRHTTHLMNFRVVKSAQSHPTDNTESGTNTHEDTVRRSLMQYSAFDWSSVPLSEERRLTEESKPPKTVTMYLR